MIDYLAWLKWLFPMELDMSDSNSHVLLKLNSNCFELEFDKCLEIGTAYVAIFDENGIFEQTTVEVKENFKKWESQCSTVNLHRICDGAIGANGKAGVFVLIHTSRKSIWARPHFRFYLKPNDLGLNIIWRSIWPKLPNYLRFVILFRAIATTSVAAMLFVSLYYGFSYITKDVDNLPDATFQKADLS